MFFQHVIYIDSTFFNYKIYQQTDRNTLRVNISLKCPIHIIWNSISFHYHIIISLDTCNNAKKLLAAKLNKFCAR